ncbi:unnamed protein product [Sphagnum troendelagicum]|uniref:Protein kinase domain-containing protein n=1 Tax=Sphagnum troendelagicum TaxID=128251 RepID=A0ABP0UTY2_9BRYO
MHTKQLLSSKKTNQLITCLIEPSSKLVLNSSSSLITNEDDAQVLLQLVRSAAPGTWDALSGWNSSSGFGNPNPCADWVGISCNPSTGRVVNITLAGMRLGTDIPSQLGDLGALQLLNLSNCNLTGQIPAEFGNCSALKQLDVSQNLLTGTIPDELSMLQSLETLGLSFNNLTGSIPAALANCTKLVDIHLENNALSGSLPLEFGSLTQLQFLTLWKNQLSGSIPLTLANCTLLQRLDLSGNQLLGELPSKLFGLKNLQAILLFDNRFSANLVNLQSLDLSHNAFSGNLMMLQDLNSLILLNVSDNQFSGPVPNNDLFKSLPPSALFGNPGLCAALSKACTSSSIPMDPPLSNQQFSGGERQSRNTGLLVGLTLSIAGLLLAAGFAILSKWHSRYWVRSQHHNSEDPEVLRPSWQLTAFKTLQFSLEEVVNNLESYSIIGKGKSGVVYRATTTDGNIVAVKKLTLPSSYSKEDSGLGGNVFEAQVERLSQLKHFNIVSILAHCSSKEVHLMLYEYMPNCSLGDVLHKHKPALQWNTRYCIALGTAEGLAYLHHTCVPSVVHGNLKSNNILLDTNLEPHIADFGLAKLLDWTFDWTSIAKIEGECGYIAPEYSFTLKATVKYDVYSYGVVLLELLTGQKVAEAGLGDGVDVVKWVQDKIQSKEPVFKLLDQCLQCLPRPVLQEALEVLGIALLCTHSSPAERPTMKDVVVLLKESRTHRDAVATNCVNE